MALYFDRQLQIGVSNNRNMDNAVVARGATIDKVSGVDELAECIAGPIVVPAPSSDLQLAMTPGVAAGRAFYLETDQDITLKFGGTEADRAISIKVPSTTITGKVFMDIEFDSVYVTLGGTTDANIYYAVIGA